MSEETLIVGAGPTGLSLAIELRRFGLPMRLIDKSEHPALWSQALVVQARTLEQMERYGIAAQAVERGRKILHARIRSNGRPLASLNFDRIPSRFPYVLFLPQNEIEDLLAAHLRSLGVEIERRTALTGFEDANDGNGGIAQLQHADGGTQQASFRWLVGCDGAHSTVRSRMGVPFAGETMHLRFSLGDLRLVGEDLPGDELQLHLLHGGEVLALGRLKDDVFRVVLAGHPEQANSKQQMPEREDFNAAFERHSLKINAETVLWRAPFMVNQRKAAHYRQQNVFLAGDAAHIHSPVGGQGMNTGIQDAANLAWKLSAVAHGADERLLDSYNEERGGVGKALLRGTSRGLRLATARNPIVAAVRDLMMRRAFRLERVQDAIVRAMSETSIHYRGSSIVSDDVGRGPLKAGDRMPDSERKGSGNENGKNTLLAGLHQSRHLLIAVDVPQQESPSKLRNTSVLSMGSRDPEWTPSLATLLGHSPLIYCVRPDGYIGFRGRNNGEPLSLYARSVGLL